MKNVCIDASYLSVIGFPRHASGQGRSLIAPQLVDKVTSENPADLPFPKHDLDVAQKMRTA